MASYLLDSDVIIEYFRNKTQTVELVDSLGPKIKLWISVLSLIEVKSGAMESVESKIDRFFNFAKIIPVNLEIADMAAWYMKRWKKKGITLYLVDAAIAATCIVHDLTLVTYNKRDYPMKELEVISS